ncbi:MAG: SDR family NAD(P)-dependent oxidoreductase [Clostridia bacterium]|nr:SDR family NAD(P)-dependent oxidoreductase [Clostridia bacterium]
MSIASWIQKHTHSLAGRTVAISGATGGLGSVLCRHLVSLGASLVLLDRNLQRSRALAERLRADFPALSVRHITVDLTDMESVKRAAEELLTLPIDYLILNAGAYSIPRCVCDTGYDNVYQINFVAPYYLARRLLPMLRARGGRVVAVGSIAHDYSRTDPTDIDFRTRKKASLVYGNAKRQLMIALLAEVEHGGVAVTHPGITFTNITAHYPKLVFALIKHPMKVIFMRPRKACLSILSGLFESHTAREWIGPRYFNIWGCPTRKALRTFTDEEAARVCADAEHIYTELCK